MPLIPPVAGLSFMLGWGSLMGLGLSLLSASFRFAAALYSPFSIAIAQKLAGVEVYSGTWPRQRPSFGAWRTSLPASRRFRPRWAFPR